MIKTKMKNLLILNVCLFFSSPLLAQITFEKGYFTDNNNQKKECFIKNEDWKDNPQQFQYRFTETEETQTQTQTIDNIQEFRVYGYAKYIKATVWIETSSSEVDKMSRLPKLVTKQIKTFLKVLVEGNAQLLYYEQGNLRHFFAQIDTNPIEPLYYKEYLNDQNVREVAPFRQYLLNHLKCLKKTPRDFERLKYKQSDLVDLFRQYNQCVNPNPEVQPVKSLKNQLNLKIIVALNSHRFNYVHYSGKTYPILNDVKPGLGFEVEDFLRFNKNRWSVSVAPNFYFFNISNKDKYVAFEMPISIRDYFYLKPDQKLYVSAGLNLNFPIVKAIQLDSSSYPDKLLKTTCWILGAGYAFKQWNAEFRYYAPQYIVNNLFAEAKYQKLSLIFAYKF
jgi:hypothetical protein